MNGLGGLRNELEMAVLKGRRHGELCQLGSDVGTMVASSGIRVNGLGCEPNLLAMRTMSWQVVWMWSRTGLGGFPRHMQVDVLGAGDLGGRGLERS